MIKRGIIRRVVRSAIRGNRTPAGPGGDDSYVPALDFTDPRNSQFL